ncbi:hypothetical protein GCM10023192_88660 [Amycolatopsis samaneae]
MQPAAAVADQPCLGTVEWVTSHLEAHGPLLVRGTTLAEIVSRARTAFPLGSPHIEHADVGVAPEYPGKGPLGRVDPDQEAACSASAR